MDLKSRITKNIFKILLCNILVFSINVVSLPNINLFPGHAAKAQTNTSKNNICKINLDFKKGTAEGSISRQCCELNENDEISFSSRNLISKEIRLATAIDYALIQALLAVAIVVTLTFLGKTVKSKFKLITNTVNADIGGATEKEKEINKEAQDIFNNAYKNAIAKGESPENAHKIATKAAIDFIKQKKEEWYRETFCKLNPLNCKDSILSIANIKPFKEQFKLSLNIGNVKGNLEENTFQEVIDEHLTSLGSEKEQELTENAQNELSSCINYLICVNPEGVYSNRRQKGIDKTFIRETIKICTNEAIKNIAINIIKSGFLKDNTCSINEDCPSSLVCKNGGCTIESSEDSEDDSTPSPSPTPGATPTPIVTTCTSGQVSTSEKPCVCASGAEPTNTDGSCVCTNDGTYSINGCSISTEGICQLGEFSTPKSTCTCANGATPTGRSGTCVCTNGNSYRVQGCNN